MHTTVHGSGKSEKERKHELTGKEMNVMDVMVWNVASAQIPLLSASCEYLFFCCGSFFLLPDLYDIMR
jgi:hypothetical protein